MKFIRRWSLPTLDEPITEYLEQIPQWGGNYFWYCAQCRQIYASADVLPEDHSRRPWRGISGLCLTCPPNRFAIRGELGGAVMIRLDVPGEVLHYLLDREIDFLGHPAYPQKELVNET